MTALSGATLTEVGVDAAALKPTEMSLYRAVDLSVETLTVDYEGRDHVPKPETLAHLAADNELRLTAPVRADGYDPLGDDELLRATPDDVGFVAVAGHSVYLDGSERRRAVAPRLRAMVQQAEDPWVGTEGIERLALAVGGTQYELLSTSTERSVRALRAAGYEGEIAVYAPTVLTDRSDVILDAVGAYAARRPSVGNRLPDDAPTDSTVTGETRQQLLDGCREYALVGSVQTVSERIDRLREVGVDHVVAYPARGLDPFLG